VTLWTGRQHDIEVTRVTTVQDVLERVEFLEKKLSAKTGMGASHDFGNYYQVPAEDTKLAIGVRAVAESRGIIRAFEEEISDLQAWRSMDRGALDDHDDTPGERRTVLRCSVVLAAAEDVVCASFLREDPIFAFAYTQEKALCGEAPVLFEKDSGDDHVWGTAEAFTQFMHNRRKRVGNVNKIRPIRSAQFRANFPVQATARWHEMETLVLEERQPPPGQRRKPLRRIVRTAVAAALFDGDA